MKITVLTLTLVLTALAQLTAQLPPEHEAELPQADSPIVQLVYFRPSDRPVRPNVDAEIDGLIKKVQRLFADEMERHGFGRKTFQFEADANGNAVVYHVNGKFPSAHYQQNRYSWVGEIHEQIHIPDRSITVHMLDSDRDDGGRSFTGHAGTGGGSPYGGGRADIDDWHWHTLAHELGHAFGMGYHDHRRRYLMNSGGYSEELSPCFAAWLDVHPAFNPTVVRRDTRATIQMLSATLAAPPNAIRLRWTVTAPAGSLYQARLQKPQKNFGGLIGCKRIDGNPTSSTVEFVTTALTPDNESVGLSIIGIDGNIVGGDGFPIDVASLLPPAKVVSIPDPNLAAAVRESLNMSSGEPVTTHSILDLFSFYSPLPTGGIKDLTGLEHAVNLTTLYVRNNPISNLSPLASLTKLRTLDLQQAGVSDVSALANLTNLEMLNLMWTGVSDVSALANLTKLRWLNLYDTDVSDVSALANLTKLRTLDLRFTDVSDVSALANLTKLRTLNLAGTAVSDISPLATLTNLEELNLGGTAVSDVSALAALTNLKTLELGGIDVSDVSVLAGLTNLEELNLNYTGVSDVSALAHLTKLETLNLRETDVSDVSALAALTNLKELDLQYTAVSDVSALAHLTNLEEMRLWYTDVSDVSTLANFTHWEGLLLRGTGVSDVSALANFTHLKWLDLRETDVSDVSPLLGLSLPEGVSFYGSPLSYASIHTHIPALQAKGIEVEFDNVAHPALLKVSGDGQEGEPGAMLETAFVVAAMDEHGEPIVGRTVAFDILGGGGSLGAETVETDAQGNARVTLTLGSSQGVNKVRASSEGIRSWVLFTAVATEEAPELVADVNGDGVVNIQDLVLVAGQFGKTGEHGADVNGDGVVNIQDLVLVAGAFEAGAAAPSVRAVSRARLTVSDVEGWLNEARAVSSVGQDRLILTSFSRQTHLVSGSGSGEPELQSGNASRPGGLSYGRGIAVLERLLASLMPKETVLLANYPNPFNPETWIPYQLSKPAEVTVTIYAANGAVVQRLDLGHRRAGSYESRGRAAYWDGRNAVGEPVASGVYFYTLSAGDFSATRKMVIRK